MSYTKSTNFAVKDTYLTGNPSKAVRGSEIDTEFNAIQAADALNVKTADIGVTVQAYDADLTAFAGKTAPTGAVVGTTDTQTLTNKTLDSATNTLTGTQSGLTVGTAETVSTTIASGAVGTTQSANDNSTKIATTAYADRAASAVSSVQIQPISASVGSNALTISASALRLDFRSTTLGSGTVTTVSGTPANLVISSGSTLGTTNAIASRIAVLAINNAGTIELAAVNIAGGNQLDETNLITTTAEGGVGAADSANVIYSTTARTSVAYRVLGYIESTQATAGTWASAPSVIQGAGGQSLQHVNAICNSVAVATTSGTAIDFTGIPSWAKRITVMFNEVSTNGTSQIQTQIGAGSVQTSGYAAQAGVLFNSVSMANNDISTGFPSGYGAASTQAISGSLSLSLVGANVWLCSGTIRLDSQRVAFVAGKVTLPGTLDRLRLTTVGGTDTFDAGSVNILYE